MGSERRENIDLDRDARVFGEIVGLTKACEQIYQVYKEQAKKFIAANSESEDLQEYCLQFKRLGEGLEECFEVKAEAMIKPIDKRFGANAKFIEILKKVTQGATADAGSILKKAKE